MVKESSRDPWGTVIRKPFYLIMVYGRWGSEPHSNASTLKEAKAKALAASKRDPKNEYVVEIEPGGFDNPIYKGGKSLRMTKMRSGRLQRRKSVVRMGLRKKVGRDPGRKTKAAAHGQKASEYVRRGRAAEDEGMFSSAAVWYGKAAAHYAKAAGPHSTRARLWAKRAKDVKRPAGKRQMGTTYRGERKAWHRDPSKRRIVHGRAVRHETASHHASASKREDKTEYILHWYSRENIGAPTRHESRWFGSSHFPRAKREAEEFCDRSESKRFIRLERLTDRDPAMHKRSHHRAKKARALRVTDDLKFYSRGAARRPKIAKRRRLQTDLYVVVGKNGLIVGHVKGTWLGEAERRAKLKFGPHAHVWTTSSRRVVGAPFTRAGRHSP
jgi:hypothetical protein